MTETLINPHRKDGCYVRRLPLLASLITCLTILSGCASQNKNTVVVDSENQDTRVRMIIIHHTSEDFQGSLDILTKDSSRPVSSHYLVPEPGDPSYKDKTLKVYQLVPEAGRAWHAGSSYWAGRTALNDMSVGIEIVNQNDGVDPYPADQFEAIVELVGYLADKYDIQREWIVTHADISTVGKTDPRGFPTHELIMRVYDPAANLPDDVVREAAWNAAGIPFNPRAAFPRYAREHNLGTPQTEEFDFSYKGVNYRGQGFSEAIVYAQVGDWENLKEMSW